MKISNEVIGPSSGDLLGQIRQRQVNAYIARERAELAAVTDEYIAWMFYPPTPHDDPAEYAPYWSHLTDIVSDAADFNPRWEITAPGSFILSDDPT